jgi:hypothetical protein
MVAAGATMTGVTRLTVTLAVILFELTGSLDHVLPFSLGILVAKWTADAIEPLSIYDLLTDMNSYPFLDNKVRPVFTTELGDITPRVREQRIIDISDSPLVPATELREKQEYLHMCGEIDGGIAILRDGILVGLIPGPDLEFALDKLDNEENTLCLMSTQVGWAAGRETGAEEDAEEEDPTDFTPYIDPSPIALDIHSPMDLVYECFVKLGLRYVCVLRDGQYAGLVSLLACQRRNSDANQSFRYTRKLSSNTSKSWNLVSIDLSSFYAGFRFQLDTMGRCNALVTGLPVCPRSRGLECLFRYLFGIGAMHGNGVSGFSRFTLDVRMARCESGHYTRKMHGWIHSASTCSRLEDLPR